MTMLCTFMYISCGSHEFYKISRHFAKFHGRQQILQNFVNFFFKTENIISGILYLASSRSDDEEGSPRDSQLRPAFRAPERHSDGRIKAAMKAGLKAGVYSEVARRVVTSPRAEAEGRKLRWCVRSPAAAE